MFIEMQISHFYIYKTNINGARFTGNGFFVVISKQRACFLCDDETIFCPGSGWTQQVHRRRPKVSLWLWMPGFGLRARFMVFALCVDVHTSCGSLSKTKATILFTVEPHLRFPRVTNTSPVDTIKQTIRLLLLKTRVPIRESKRPDCWLC